VSLADSDIFSPHPVRLAPSILAADHSALHLGLERIQKLPIEWLHLDIMDGHFVPNLSFGPQTVKALRRRDRNLFFDTHLMLDNPDQHVDAFLEAGADLISIHVEPDYPIRETLLRIKSAGRQCGVVINPGTPAEATLPFLEYVDLVLVMSVWPGFGGQKFIPDTVGKMRQLHLWRLEKNLSYRLEVDGGIDLDTAQLCRSAGVDTLVAGTAFFQAADPSAFIQAIEGPHPPATPPR
jgi:ribulose-phosphate 3-epimerase